MHKKVVLSSNQEHSTDQDMQSTRCQPGHPYNDTVRQVSEVSTPWLQLYEHYNRLAEYVAFYRVMDTLGGMHLVMPLHVPELITRAGILALGHRREFWSTGKSQGGRQES